MVLACNYQKNCCSMVFLSKFGKRTLPLHCGMGSSPGQDLSCLFFGGFFWFNTKSQKPVFLLRSSSKFPLETHQNVRMECSSFLVPEKLKALEKLQMETPQAFTMQMLLYFSVIWISSLQEASLQTLGVDMCEDMTELEFLHNELAWTLNASCDLRLGFVLDIHNIS